jgi:signal transduction histidine kinase/CheY-like chemotaxis protein/ABC-type amino acid transport substrate-binding protein
MFKTLVFGALAGFCALQAAPKRVVRLGVFSHEPAVFMGDDGKAKGFLVDMVQQVATQQGWTVQVVPGTWEEGIARMRTGELDLMPSVAHTPERDAFLDYGQESSFLVWSLLYANPQVPITSLLDVRERRVGLMRGDLNGHHFVVLTQQFNLPCAFQEFGSFPEIMAAVASGAVDAGVTANTYGYAEESKFRVVRTPVVFNPFPIYFTTPKGRNRDLLAALDTYLATGKADPTSAYYQTIERWMGTHAPRRLPAWLVEAGLATLVLLALAGLAVLGARRQVRRATREIRSLNEALQEDLSERNRLETLTLQVANGVSSASGDAFLQELVKHVAAVTGADAAYIGETTPSDTGQQVNTLALVLDGAAVDNISYPMAGTPCEKALGGEVCTVPTGVQATYPAAAILQTLRAESYVGAPLVDSQGKVQGLITVIHRKPISSPGTVVSLLRIFSARAASEMERRSTEAARQVLEEQMQHAQKLESLGVLAGGIAHDFNNLMTAMLGHLNVAQMKLAPESPAIPNLESLEKIIHRAADLTRQMLAYSGKGRFVVRPYNLNQVVQEVTHLLEVSISKKVALRYDLAPVLPMVEADAAQIQQVIMNLVTNAADAIGDHEGTIRLTTGTLEVDRPYLEQAFQGQGLAPGNYVSLEVTDSGCGMSPDVLARIFDPFFTTKVAGRGLGLSATIGILKGHRAGLRIYSEVGKGTTFKLLFPSSEVQQAEASGQIAIPALMKKATVLLVDDEEMIREAATDVLESIGLQVVCAEDGQEALDIIHSGHPPVDLVLMDLTMPRMDGREAFRALHRTHPDLPVILCSGYSEKECTEELAGRGLAAFLQKPYTLRHLETTVLEVLARRG